MGVPALGATFGRRISGCNEKPEVDNMRKPARRTGEAQRTLFIARALWQVVQVRDELGSFGEVLESVKLTRPYKICHLLAVLKLGGSTLESDIVPVMIPTVLVWSSVSHYAST
jgi:hypothetical protein